MQSPLILIKAILKQCSATLKVTHGYLTSVFLNSLFSQKKNKFGIKKIAYELKSKGIWKKKFKDLPVDNQEKVKQIRFLRGRGIDLFIIQKILSGKSFEYI